MVWLTFKKHYLYVVLVRNYSSLSSVSCLITLYKVRSFCVYPVACTHTKPCSPESFSVSLMYRIRKTCLFIFTHGAVPPEETSANTQKLSAYTQLQRRLKVNLKTFSTFQLTYDLRDPRQHQITKLNK